MFSWIPIYAELAKKILTYRDRQTELIEMLKHLEAQGLPAGSTLDQEDGKKLPLTGIDPFTFFTSFNRGLTDDNRRKILGHFKSKLNLASEIPTDFDGIPIVNSQAAWFFGFKNSRKPDDIPSLWALAEAVVHRPADKLDPKLFERCLQIVSVGPAKLTMGMFWFNPQNYIALDANNRKLFEKNGINVDVGDLPSYLQLLNSVKAKLGTDYPRISKDAFEIATGRAQLAPEFTISPEQLQSLWKRFHQRISGFKDFDSPGNLEKNELEYKRKALKRYQDDIGNGLLRQWVESGQGQKSLKEISNRIQMNVVAYQSWNQSMGANDAQCSAILTAYLDAAEAPYGGPTTIEPIIQATLAAGMKPAWDTLGTVLWAMRPEDYFPVKISYYRDLAEELGHPLPSGPPTAAKFDAVIRFGRAFWSALKPQKPKDWIEVQSFIWVVCPDSYTQNDIEVAAKQYWAGGFQWGETSKLDEFVEGNSWQIGWDKEDPKRAAKKTWEYFEKVKLGDEFAIKGLGGRNDLRIHYIGQVTAKDKENGILRFQKLDRPLYRDKGPKGLSGATWFDTLVPIESPPIINAIFHGKPLAVSEEQVTTSNGSQNQLNVILYGPPGTGKTFETIERSVKLIAPDFAGDHSDHKRKYDELVRQGRIQFITFHQSYSYEDFVEGIRPVVDATDERESPRYECRPGLFKRIACNALFDCIERANDGKQLASFDFLWNSLVSQIESNPEATYPGLSERTKYQFSLTARGNIEGKNIISEKRFLCSRKILEEVFEAKRGQDAVSISEVMEVVGRGCHSQLVAAAFRELRHIEKSQSTAKPEPVAAAAPTDEEKADIVQRYLSGGEKSKYQLKSMSQIGKYVLIIDEINRGNISKILGELITLLEPDKRIGPGEHQNTLVVTLPYSSEKFAVPINLHILATMNSADKSIALVDVALRRRFEFEELQVDLNVCRTLNEAMRATLTELNRRICLRKDRDHQIGHAYFIPVGDEEAFNYRFRRQIIPLLQEYFYNDWEGLRFVLGENLKTDGGFVRKVNGADIKEARTKWQWFFDAGEELNCLETLYTNYQLG